MNSPVENTVVSTKAKAPRPPTLPAKYSKFMAFGYWMTTQLVEKAILTEAQRDSVFENLAIFQSLDEQVAFYEGFLKTSCGPSAKAIKKLVAAKNKPPKAPRAKKAKAVVEKQDDLIAKLIADANDGVEVAAVPQEGAVSEAVPKKKAAPKKSKKTDAAPLDVAPLDVAPLAEGTSEPVAPAVAEAAPKKKAAPKKSKKTETADVAEASVAEALPKKKAAAKKSKKTETVASEEPVVATEGAAAPADVAEVSVAEVSVAEASVAEASVAEALPKKKAAPKKSKKTEVAPVEVSAPPADATPVADVADDDDEDIIQTRVVAIADKEYLIDSQNNLYTIEEPHDNIGNYDPATGNVSFRPSYTATAL